MFKEFSFKKFKGLDLKIQESTFNNLSLRNTYIYIRIFIAALFIVEKISKYSRFPVL